jgi:acylphosphatase
MNSSKAIICIHCIVSGKVQGVFFRASTREQALRLNINGYAKNLHDGNVEVIAIGEQQAVEQFKQWLHHGPKNALVKNVECEVLTDQQIKNYQLEKFKIL